jgi:hypothetical protein
MKKNNLLICILCLLVVGLGCYIIYDKVISKEAKGNSNIVDYQKQDKIVVSVEEKKSEELGEYNQLVINGKSIQVEHEIFDSVMFIDDAYIIAAFRDEFEGLLRYYVYDKDGNKLYNINKLSSLDDGHVTEVNYSDKELHIEAVTVLPGDNYRSLCSQNQSDVYMKFESVKYLGDGKFAEAQTLSSLTVKDYLKNYHSYTCK